MSRKKEKTRFRRFIEKHTDLQPKDNTNKAKKRFRKPKMPARIKKTPKGRQE